jgi:hypothetical protein
VLSVGGVLYWLSTELKGREIVIAGFEVGQFMGGLFFLVVGFFFLLLVLATILMPLYVVSIHGLMKRLLERTEKLEWYAQRHHEREERKMRGG